MKYFTTKAVDLAVGDKIDLLLLDKLLADIRLPEFLQSFAEMVVLFVVREPQDSEFDAWPDKEKFYMKIPLNYREVLESTDDEITKLCLQKYEKHLLELNEEVLKQKEVYGYPSILSFLKERSINYLNADLESIVNAVRSFKFVVDNDEYFLDQIQGFLDILETERSQSDALTVSKKILDLTVHPNLF